jgi:hydrogenase maturation protease
MSRTAIIGLGNPLMGDDGFGLVALARLQEDWMLDDVDMADGGTWGMSLLPLIEDADHLILLDAIAAGAPPGDVVVLERDRLPIYLSRKLSPHQIDLRDVLAVAEWRGTLPLETVAVGVQPERVELGSELSAAAFDAVDGVVDAVIARLTQWGHRCEPRVQAEPCTR